MKLLFVLFCMIYVFSNSVAGQTPVPARTPTPAQEARIMLEQQRRRNEQFERLSNLNTPPLDNRTILNPFAHKKIEILYRMPTAKELALLSPNKEDFRAFAEFLRQPHTGLTTLAADKGCADNSKIVVATADCLAYSMPGAGSSYSFRVKNYRIPNLADITFTENSFQATGIRLHGIFVKLGDVPLEQVNLQTKGINFLTDFKPEADFQKAKEIDRQLSVGIEKDGFVYRRALRAVDDTTYVLRSVAYRGTYLRAVEGFSYNELDFDKRSDVIIAFRIVRRDADGAVTILWKQLQKQNSPKTKWKENQEKDNQSAFSSNR